MLTEFYLPLWSQSQEPSQIIERSTSLCRLNLRDGDSDHRKNGAHGSRVKERSSRFQRDCGQAPPKILISSASQGGGRRPRPVRPPTSRSWSTEDFSTELSLEGGVLSSVLSDSMEMTTEVDQTSDSSQLTSIHSPTDSSVPESINTDSINVDSAISSPDSWVDGDFGAAPEKLCESRSDSSLCDSGTAWELHRAIPVEITTLDEGFFPSTEGGGFLDEQPITELCVDEGIYSLSSLESSQEQGHSLNNPPEPVSQNECKTNTLSHIIPTDQLSDQGKFQKEGDCQQVATSLLSKDDVREQENESKSWPSDANNVLTAEKPDLPIMALGTGLPPPHFSAEEQPSEEPEGFNEAAAQDGDMQDPPTENQTKGTGADRGEEEAKGKERDAHLEEMAGLRKDEAHLNTQDRTSEGIVTEHQDPHDLQDQASKEMLAPIINKSVPLITVSTDPEMPDQEEAGDSERQAGLIGRHQSEALVCTGSGTAFSCTPRDTEDMVPVETPSCQASGSVQHREAMADLEREHLDKSDGKDLGSLSTAEAPLQTDQHGATQGCESPQRHHLDSPVTSFALATQLATDLTDLLAAHRDGLGDTVPDIEQDKSHNTHLFSLGIPGPAAGRSFPEIEFFQAELDENSPTDELDGDPLEPMDLFYPDKDEVIFNEPLERETQGWPSVLRVSPLQPAPASQLFDDGLSELLSHDFTGTNDISHENSKVSFFYC